MNAAEIWRRKSDEKVLTAALELETYTAEGRQTILAELERRGLTLPEAVSQQQALLEQTYRREFHVRRILKFVSAFLSIAVIALIAGIGIQLYYTGARTEGAALVVVALLVGIGILLYRYAPRVLALLGVAFVVWGGWVVGRLPHSALDATVSVNSAIIGVIAVRHFLLKPRGSPLVWYVTVLTSVVAIAITWLAIYSLFADRPAGTMLSRIIAFAVGEGLRQGLVIGSGMALLVFAARGRVQNPWVQPGTLARLLVRIRS
jgi:hypothetical protein